MNSIKGKPIQTGLMAYGMSGKIFHGPFLEAHSGFDLRAVVERHEKKAALDYPGIQSYGSVEELMDDHSLELIVINTPNNLHYAHAKMALEHGKHVLVEKPVCTSTEELESLCQLADQAGKQLFFYQNRRWDSDFKSCIAVIESGELGKLHEVHLRFDRYKPELSPKTFKETPMAGSGLQFDLGPHILDQAIRLFGSPEKYTKRLARLRKGTRVDDFFSIRLSYQDNLEVFVTGSLLTIEAPPAYALFGDQGSFFKQRADLQEAQLQRGMKITDPDYGSEQDAGGRLFLPPGNGGQPRYVKAAASSYIELFDAVWLSLTENKPFPVTRAQIRTQIEILSAPES